jgi:hypothetical protein
MAEPWKFDADTMALLQSRKATIVEGSRNILLWPRNGAPETAASLAAGRIAIETAATKEESVIVPEGDSHPSVPVAQRETDRNYAILRFTGDGDKGKPIPAVDSPAGQSWDRVAVFKLNSDGKTETVFVPARREGNRILFDSPVDDEALGSPVIVPGGVIGMVQTERSGTILPK